MKLIFGLSTLKTGGGGGEGQVGLQLSFGMTDSPHATPNPALRRQAGRGLFLGLFSCVWSVSGRRTATQSKLISRAYILLRLTKF